MIELVIPQRRRDLGGFEVGRVLPFPQRPRQTLNRPARNPQGSS